MCFQDRSSVFSKIESQCRISLSLSSIDFIMVDRYVRFADQYLISLGGFPVNLVGLPASDHSLFRHIFAAENDGFRESLTGPKIGAPFLMED